MKSSIAHVGALVFGCCGVSIADPMTVVWQGNADNATNIYVLDLAPRLVAYVPSPGRTGGMTRVGDQIWWGSIDSPGIVRLDFSGTVLGTITAFPDEPTGGMTTVGDEVWWGSATSQQVVRMDFSGNVVGTFDHIGDGSSTGGLATVGSEVWWGGGDPGASAIWQYDFAGNLLGGIDIPESSEPTGGMTAVGDEVWWSANNSHPEIYILDFAGSVIRYDWTILAIHATGGLVVAEADLPDADSDNVSDTRDNCLGLSNPDQHDTDQDFVGNLCDPDVHVPNDCFVNFLDLNVYRANFLLSGDLDTDNNGDGQTNFADLNTVRDFFLQPPGPSANGCN